MKNRVLIAVLCLSAISMFGHTITACNTPEVAGQESVSDNNIEVEEVRNIDAEISRELVPNADNTTKNTNNYTVVYESDDFSIAVTSNVGGRDDKTFPIVINWGSVEDMDMAVDIIQAIYSKYDSGISELVNSYEVSTGYVLVYQLNNGDQIEVVKFDDHKLNLRDAETAEDFWTSVEYYEKYGGEDNSGN